MASNQELLAKLEALQAENEALRAAKNGKVSCKVTEPRAAGENGPADKGSQGGAVAVYGLGRFPVTLYKSQWKALLAFVPELTKFITDNDGKLTDKASK